LIFLKFNARDDQDLNICSPPLYLLRLYCCQAHNCEYSQDLDALFDNTEGGANLATCTSLGTAFGYAIDKSLYLSDGNIERLSKAFELLGLSSFNATCTTAISCSGEHRLLFWDCSSIDSRDHKCHLAYTISVRSWDAFCWLALPGSLHRRPLRS